MQDKIWFAITISVFLLGYWFGKASTPKDSEIRAQKIATVKRGDLVVDISEIGVLKAQNSTRITSGIPSAVKIAYVVKEGIRVKKGDVLVKFDTEDVKREIENAQQKIRATQAKYEAAQGQMEILKIENESNATKLRLAYIEAQKNLEKYVQGELPLAIQEKEIKLEVAKAELEQARKKVEQMPDLLKQGFVTKDQMKAKTIKLKEQQIKYDTAKSELELFTKYTKPLEIQKKEAAAKKAQGEWESSQKQMQAKLKQKLTEIESRKLEIENHQAELKKLQEKLAKMTIPAPTNGLIIYGEPGYWRELDIRVGMEVWDHTPIITLPDLSHMQVALRVHEVDIQSIHLDMPVVVTVESAGNISLAGKISRIAELANSGGWMADPEVKQFDVDITIVEKSLQLKPGTTAKVDIITLRLKDVLYLPLQAIQVKEHEKFCYIQNGNSFQHKTVTLGQSNDKYVEIKSGLKEGEQVLLSRP